MNEQTAVFPQARRARRWGKIIAWVLGGLCLLAFAAYFGIGTAAAVQLSAPKRNFDPANNPSLFNLAYEEVRYPARVDATTIAAWYIPSAKNTRAVILVNGRDDSRTYAFKGHFVDFAAALQQAGYSVLMIDLRGHGQSGDGRFTFGIKERRDVLGGVDWLTAHGYQPKSIAVFGYSLGGGSVIGAAAEEPSVGAVVTEAAYADIK
ncbi:MAG TPA: alpha/beta fold hydrolase, partial [Anaerolineaceae bacterium]